MRAASVPFSQRTTCKGRDGFDQFQIAFASAAERDHSCDQGRRQPGGRPPIQVAAVSGFMHRQGKTPMPTLTINGRSLSVDAANDTPLLWAIREQLQMTGTKFGCGAGLCGACTVHVNGEAVRSCQTMVGDVAGKKITTIEGLSAKGDHPLQKAWIAEQVPQCGYCQSGQIMQAASLLAKNANPTKEEVVAHMDGNLCRCMTYSRIQKAIMRAATEMRTASASGNERRPT
ncbi:blr0840 [Bradyrhizobium diazoefficiens USDA 110]|uniref:Blr0840 protein n=3 Tax=Bradyrhizobium TaxID=374 RepID=Q89W53_BRADU|nr:(2Fe-2S)-binding protein [Bradyrhizobium diazoefficiens]QBP19786.1 (2Fe-2S)-binding protein [Bradyrhizobium diazoefficiens]BAC46105.1 blr0840 [Bradyrhizobium diazoefficiens USDA 110]